MKPHCLITGCELVATDTGATAHGDLHQVGLTFIFNAVCNERGETNWMHAEPHSQRVVYIDSGYAFERRAVIVFAAADAKLSAQAESHIANAPL